MHYIQIHLNNSLKIEIHNLQVLTFQCTIQKFYVMQSKRFQQ